MHYFLLTVRVYIMLAGRCVVRASSRHVKLLFARYEHSGLAFACAFVCLLCTFCWRSRSMCANDREPRKAIGPVVTCPFGAVVVMVGVFVVWHCGPPPPPRPLCACPCPRGVLMCLLRTPQSDEPVAVENGHGAPVTAVADAPRERSRSVGGTRGRLSSLVSFPSAFVVPPRGVVHDWCGCASVVRIVRPGRRGAPVGEAVAAVSAGVAAARPVETVTGETVTVTVTVIIVIVIAIAIIVTVIVTVTVIIATGQRVTVTVTVNVTAIVTVTVTVNATVIAVATSGRQRKRVVVPLGAGTVIGMGTRSGR